MDRWRRMIAGLAAVALAVAVGRAGAQTPPTPDETSRYGGLLAAAHRGDLASIRRLVAASKDALRERDGHGRSALHLATWAKRHDAIRLLMQLGIESSLLDAGRYDAVTVAAVAGDDDTLRVLLAAGASAKLVTSRWDGTALIAAAHEGHPGVVRQLIAAGAPLDHVNNLHWTALIEAIVLGDGGPNHQAIVRDLLAAGASTRLADREGRTPLALARSRGYEAMVQMLMAAGAK